LTEHSATEISLAENAIRTDMHPATNTMFLVAAAIFVLSLMVLSYSYGVLRAESAHEPLPVGETG
jgi:hypothetical protein